MRKSSRTPYQGNHVFLIAIVTSLFVSLAVFYLVAPSPFKGEERSGGEAATFLPASPLQAVTTSRVRPVEVGTAQILPSGADGLVMVPELNVLASRLNEPASTIEEDLEVISALLSYFHRAFQGSHPPAGENDEFTAQLSGRNAKRLALLPPDHRAINDKGQLVDRWGTPFHFHPVSQESLELRSAGPDRKLYTADDASN